MSAPIVELDLSTLKALEARRMRVDETHLQIIKRELGIDDCAYPISTVSAEDIPRRRHSRATGKFEVLLNGRAINSGSMKEAYKESLVAMSKLKPDFWESLAARKMRSRRIVARSPEALYVKSHHLAEKFADPIGDGWWVDTNLSSVQVKQRLGVACEVAGLNYGRSFVACFLEEQLE